MDDINVTPVMADSSTVENIQVRPQRPAKTAADWVRDMRMSPEVNKTTVGVETDHITPELLMATSSKLLGISRREQDPDPKDSLLFQRFYGPAEYFAEHVLRDGGKVARNLLWKATNKGKIDFVPSGALDQHISDVFYTSKLAQMIDGSSPLETVDAAFKTTRVGEGGVADVQSAPDEMRTVQASYFGYLDPVRSAERKRVGLDMYMTKNVLKGSDGKLYQRFINARTGKEELVDSVTASKSIVAAPEMMDADTKSVFALGGRTGVRIVPKDQVDYYLPRADDAYSTASNLVAMPNGVKEMRLLMGCLHPGTPLVTISSKNEITITPAKSIGKNAYGVPGCDGTGKSTGYLIRNSIAKFPQKRKWFKKVVLLSGRSLITSYDHRWPVLRDNALVLVNTDKLQPGDQVLRSAFKDLPNRRTFMRGVLVNKDVATLLGCIVRSVTQPEPGKLRVVYQPSQKTFIDAAIKRLKLEGSRFYANAGDKCLAIHDVSFIQWVEKEICIEPEERRVPTVILSACLDIASHFIDAYTANPTQVGIDSNEDMWILDIPSMICRDGLALLLARMQTDTLYRDAVRSDGVNLALKLVEQAPTFGDSIVDEVKVILEVEKVPIMIDIDIDDNMYAAANGIITHNSKYPLQAISLLEREAPLVRNLDEATGKDMPTLVGKYLGARFAKQGGTVTAVRKDRIDVIYDDGTKGQVSLYQNFPMNAKGYITNTPVVKAGQSFKKGDILASSNYTDDKGVAAIGKNLRSGWLSWKGGTYEDAVVLSESAAKALTSRTMYKSAVDLDKTVSLGKKNYVSWKPSEYTKDQLEALDDNGIVKPGAVLRRGDPMILAVQTTEPSPGTLGKRVLTDISETWEHDHPGVVTDVVKTRKGVKVYATVEAPAEIGDKISGHYGNKGVVSQLGKETPESEAVNDDEKEYSIQRIVPDAMMPLGEDGKPLDLLFSPLGLVSRTNASMIHEALLGKIARKTGKPYVTPAFYKGDLYDLVESQLKQHHINDTEDLTDPYTGKKIPKVLTGVSYIYKLKHQAESKLSARGTDSYTAEGQPGGGGFTGSKRYGTLESSALVGHNCLTGSTRVVTATGYMPISQIVNNRLSVDVLSYNIEKDLFEYKKVTNWFAKSVSQEDLWQIQTNARAVDGKCHLRGYHHKLVCTKEHRILRPDGTYTEAQYLKKGDLVVNRGQRLMPWQMQIVLGTLMGDGSLSNATNRIGTGTPALSFVHGPTQLWYTDWLYAKLRNICNKEPKVVEHKIGKTGRFNTGTQKRLQTINTYELTCLCDEFYHTVNGKRTKRVPAGIVKRLGWPGIAVWFMDDGSVENYHKDSKAFTLHTCSFTKVECEALCQELSEFTGLPWTVLMKAGKYPILRLRKGPRGIQHTPCHVFAEKLAPYIPEEFRYKLGTFLEPGTVLGTFWEDKAAPSRAVVGEPCVITESAPCLEPPAEGFTVYDITVEDNHNFMVTGIVVSNSFANLLDAKLLRGQSNSDFWRSIRTGEIPTIPGEPLVHRKFFAHLTGSGVNVRKTPKGISVFSLSNDDVKELAGPRELKSKDTYEAKTFRPIDGGLFGQDLFGPNGDRWAYIQLDEPLPNPVMEEPLARLLRMSTKDFMAVAAGKAEVNGMKSSADIKERLSKINLEAEEKQAQREFKDAPMSKKDAALKRYRDIARMKANEVPPDQYMLDRIPVLPPIYRPVSTHNGLTMVADSNYLYAQMMDARDDVREAKNLPAEYQQQARENLYRSWKELTGMYEPENVKLKNKHVQGLLKWALGNSPKWSAFQRKVLGSTVDTVGRGVIAPDPRLKLNQLGVPVPMALGIFEPFVARAMVKQGYTPVEALKMIKARDKRVMPVLVDVMKHSPVQLNRAPSLHKLNIMGFEPVLVAGHAVKVNPSIVVPFAADFDGNCCDFDSVIFLKLSKSALEKTAFMSYIDHSNKPEQNKEVSMITEDSRVVVFNPGEEEDPDTVYCAMKIGEFPRKGVPVKDRNGALVYPVPEGVSVLSCDPVTGVPEFRPVSAVTVEENCHTVELSFGSRKIIVSDNESLAAFDSKEGKLIKVSPAEIGDRMVPVLKKQQLPYGPFGDRDLGWLFGAFISDGWVTHNMVGYAKLEDNKRADFVRIMRSYHENFTCKEYADQPKAGNNKLGTSVKLHLFSKSLADWMRSWQLVNEDDQIESRAALRKQINSKMIQYGSEDFLWGLFSGMLDGDGSIIKNTAMEKPRFTARFSTSSKQLADDICALCYRLGLRYSMTVVPPRGFSNTAYIIIPSSIDLHANLDKLTCIGERECQLIVEWKQQAPSKDTKDMIPLSVKEAEVLLKLATARKDVGVSSGIYKTRKKSCIYGGRSGLMRYCDDIKEMFPELYARIKNENTIWQTVTAVEDAGKRQVFDLMVEGTKVFAINNGVIIWDTANVHAPVSDNARRETYEKMFPERNLISMRNRQILYKPEKEYMQGLYVATRMKKGTGQRPRIFSSVEEARQALRKGIIDIDDPIEIRKQ